MPSLRARSRRFVVLVKLAGIDPCPDPDVLDRFALEEDTV